MNLFNLGRRQFLKLGSAFLAFPSLMKPSEGNAESSAKTKEIKKEELTADLIIVGGGGGGLSSAVKAAQLGIKNIIVLEKLSFTGGNAVNPHPPVIETGEHRRATLYDEPADAYFERAMDWSHWRMNARLVRCLLERTLEVPKWLDELGVKAESEPTPEGRGVIVRIQAQKCRELGIRILTNTGARELITDKTGRVVGVVAESEENELRINARCVIMSTGGFLGNRELMRRFCKQYNDAFYDDVYLLGLPHTGDGFLMAEAVGGVSDGTSALEWEVNRFPWMSIAEPLVQLTEPSATKNIWVNKKGLRFADESETTANNAYYGQPNKTAWIIFDSAGYREGIKMLRTSKYSNVDEMHKALEQQLKEQAEKGRVKVSGSWDEIAETIGCDPAVLKATIGEYNSFCEKGKDDMFLRDVRFMSSIAAPPFYAIKSALAMLMTRGPLKVNTRMEVVDGDDDPIPGLYAAGVDIGGTDEDTYWGTGTGHSYIWAILSGCIASENAAEIILDKGIA